MGANADLLAIDDPRWRAFVAGHGAATPMHNPAWCQLIAGRFGLRAVVAGVLNGDAIVGGVPLLAVGGRLRGRRLVALPLSDHCQPLVAAADCAELIRGLREAMERFSCTGLEVRWHLPANGPEDDAIVYGAPFLVHRSALGADPAAMLAAAHRTRVRQPIALARRSGVCVRRSLMWDDVLRYYRLHARARQRHGVPPQPLGFFRDLWERLIAGGAGFVMLAERNATALAGGLFLTWNGMVMYKYGAVEPEGRAVGAGHLLIAETMAQCAQQGFSMFDWGRTEPGHESLRRFKAAWGAEELICDATYLGDARGGVASSGRVLRAVGGIVRHSPVWVARALGAAFYRFIL